MERETDNAANPTEAAAKAGEGVFTEMTKAGVSAGKAGERVGAETAERFQTVYKAYSGVVEAALQAVQDYNTKLVQVFRTNAEANLQLGQTLMQTRSPTEFIETMSKSMRERTDLIAGQTKELAALRLQATRSMIEAMSAGRA